MRPRTQKQPQVKKELCRVLDDVDVDVDVCANIYTPNDTSSKIIFIRHVQNLLQQFSGENIIIDGDLNCPFAKDDKEGGRDLSFKKNVVAELKLLLSSLDLEDV